MLHLFGVQTNATAINLDHHQSGTDGELDADCGMLGGTISGWGCWSREDVVRCWTWCWIRESAASATLPVSQVEDEHFALVCGPEVGDIYYLGTYFYFRMPDLRRLDEEVDELMGSDVPTNIYVYIRKEVGSGSGCFSGTSCEACDRKGETCNTQT